MAMRNRLHQQEYWPEWYHCRNKGRLLTVMKTLTPYILAGYHVQKWTLEIICLNPLTLKQNLSYSLLE